MVFANCIEIRGSVAVTTVGRREVPLSYHFRPSENETWWWIITDYFLQSEEWQALGGSFNK